MGSARDDRRSLQFVLEVGHVVHVHGLSGRVLEGRGVGYGSADGVEARLAGRNLSGWRDEDFFVMLIYSRIYLFIIHCYCPEYSVMTLKSDVCYS